MKNQFYLLIICLIAIVGCRKDDIITNQDVVIPPPTVIEYETGKVYGKVTDRDQNIISEAQIIWGNTSLQTDENGFFSIEAVVQNRNAVLTVLKDGYFTATKTVQVNPDQALEANIQLIPRNITGSIQATTGGEITTNSNGKITFPANAFQDESGNSYTGQVNVYTHYLDPTIDDLDEVMPGNLMAVNQENEAQLLKSYGMMNVELEDDAGNPLQLSKNATLTTPVPTSLQGQAPDNIPLWHFDTDSGMWIEEGAATLQGNVYVGEVAHFTWWNCDVPQDFIFLEGRIDSGNRFPYYQVQITQLSNETYGIVNTFEKGFFEGNVPKDEILLLEVFNQCQELLYSEQIGPFNTDTNLPVINIDSSSDEWINITGIVVDCNGQGVSNSYVVIRTDDGLVNDIVLTNDDGIFQRVYQDCGATDITYFGVDIDASLGSTEETVTIAPELNFGNISACDQVIEQAFTLTIDGVDQVWTPCTVSIDENSGAYTVKTTQDFPNGSVQHELVFIDWNMGVGEPLWAMSYQYTVFGSVDQTYIINVSDFNVIEDSTTPGSIWHFSSNEVTVTDELSGTVYENCTLDIKALVQ